ncbi:hypothetical protein FACS1894132_03610 [Clostridia bacterium]|nr:hypothetical protein FACS1894132_03610 [Clostridia bacterium]
MKRLNKIIIAGSSLVALSLVTVFITANTMNTSNSNNFKDNTGNNLEEVYAGCVHFDGDEDFSGYNEPVIPQGKYYLNGNISEIYWEISDNTIQFGGVEPREYWEERFTPTEENLADPEQMAFYNANLDAIVEKYSTVHPYIVETKHYFADTVWIKFNRIVDENGKEKRASYLEFVNGNLQIGSVDNGDFQQFIRN